jgi:mono/diheme cytochrome c family protein
MSSSPNKSPKSQPALQSPKPVVVWTAIGLVCLSIIWALRDPSPRMTPNVVIGEPPLTPDKVPLVTGEEAFTELFTHAGCAVCHVIPGIPGANGHVGPPLILGSTGPQRLQDPTYHGDAKTVHEYIVESVLDPQRFVVQGYPEHTMPAWYGSKLSALALEKIAGYLERQTAEN